MERKNRLGEKHVTNEGYEVEIIEYINSANCTIIFNNGCIIHNKCFDDIKKGKIRNPYHKSIYNVGYFGEGTYLGIVKNKRIKSYEVWVSMLTRCYYEKYKLRHPSYIGCSVVEEWHNYQVFAKWFTENYVEGYQLDKDLLVKGNKIYGPDTCCFVPSLINNLIGKSGHNLKTDKTLPLRVTKSGNKFSAYCSFYGKDKYLGVYFSIEEAFEKYKLEKELYIKEVAEIYKDKITINCYLSLLNYKVEITD
jgi:hypothetical protein